MGLDMYIYKISKISEQEALWMFGKPISFLKEKFPRCDFFPVPEEDSEDYALVEGLVPYAHKIAVLVEKWNFEKIRKGFGIPDYATDGRVCMIGGGKTCFSFTKPVSDFCGCEEEDEESESDDAPENASERFEAEIPDDEQEKYVDVVAESAYVVKQEEIAYYRKYYVLQEALHQLSPVTVENCGYYEMTDDMLDAVSDYDNFFQTPDLEDGEALFYWEWY